MRIWIETSWLIGITAIAALTDLKYRKVFNYQLIVMLIVGVMINTFFNESGKLSFYGFILPFMIHYLPFKLSLVSAGDVKLFMLVGLFSGVQFIVMCMVISYLIGGVVAIAMMIRQKCLISKLNSIYVYILSVFITKEPMALTSVGKEKLTMPFAPVIHFAVLVQVLYLG